MAITRVVESELLDNLDASDPEALRSRRDLRMINALMGNQIWFLRQFRKFPPSSFAGIVEIGAGEGCLSRAIHRHYPGIPLTAMDLQPRPAGLVEDISWIQGNLFDLLPRISADVLIGGMIIHHFTDDQLAMLGSHLQNFRAIFVCEPYRSRFSMALAYLMWPLVGRVTRHDMPASIRAGFRRGELADLLQLSGQWEIHETVDGRGSLRFAAIRR
jgi:2-polyprenyl-3-methyl-5-hydroxy-6-metoxy-1,4-benzoquinol methylase